MLYDAGIIIKLPGNSKEDAIERLKKLIPHREFELLQIEPSKQQPPSVTGTGDILMPILAARGNG